MVLKSSHNSDRYKQPEEDVLENEEGRDEDYDEYGDEIVDLGEDIQPFSMQFKADDSLKQMTGVIKADVTYKQNVVTTHNDEDEEE